MAKKNPYSVLRVLPTASHADIRNAYLSRLEIVRPGRFDAKTQPEEWKRVTKMVREIQRGVRGAERGSCVGLGWFSAAPWSRGKDITRYLGCACRPCGRCGSCCVLARLACRFRRAVAAECPGAERRRHAISPRPGRLDIQGSSAGTSAHIIQLIRQVSGNLPTTQIGPRDW